MPETHPSRETLEAFSFGNLSKTESREVIRHLLDECEPCQRISGELWQQVQEGLSGRGEAPPTDTELADSPYSAAIDGAVAAASHEHIQLQAEQVQVEPLCDEILEHPQARRITLAKSSRRFQTWALCEALIARSFAARFDHPDEGVEIARTAVAVAEHLDLEVYGQVPVVDQLGRAWAYLGNALRVHGDLREAEKAFAEAKTCFERGSRDDLDRALWLRFHSHLLATRSEFETARGQQDQAIALYRRYGQFELAANLQADQALGMLYSGDPEAALPRFEQALELFAKQEDERKIAMMRHNMAYCFHELERYDEAFGALEVSTPVLGRLGDTLSVLRGRWLEAKIAIGRDDLVSAENLLAQVSEELGAAGISYDAALASLELSVIYLAQGRTAELKKLVGQMLPIFQSQDVHREALAALVLFREAVEAEVLTLAEVEAILTYLQEARNNPELKYRE